MKMTRFIAGLASTRDGSTSASSGRRCLNVKSHMLVNEYAKACSLGGLLGYTRGIFTVSGDLRRWNVVDGWDLLDSAAWYSAWFFGAEAGVVF
jgi:hypothetical protein